MAVIATRLHVGTSYVSRAIFMGKVLGTPQLHFDAQGEVAVILLHVQEPSAQKERPFAEPINEKALSLGAEQRHTLALLVRGKAARWCIGHLKTGATVAAEAKLIPLGTSEAGVSIIALEAERLQLAADTEAPPHTIQPAPSSSGTAFRSPAYLSTAHSMRTN